MPRRRERPTSLRSLPGIDVDVGVHGSHGGAEQRRGSRGAGRRASEQQHATRMAAGPAAGHGVGIGPRAAGDSGGVCMQTRTHTHTRTSERCAARRTPQHWSLVTGACRRSLVGCGMHAHGCMPTRLTDPTRLTHTCMALLARPYSPDPTRLTLLACPYSLSRAAPSMTWTRRSSRPWPTATPRPPPTCSNPNPNALLQPKP